ncbi:MAG TPA: GGDEF domain-containing protein [Rugosimonospora sp.]
MVHDPPRRRWPALLTAGMLGYTAGTLVTRQTLLRQVATFRALAEHDPLTGLPNRRALLAEAHTRLATRTPTVLALLDLDDFKTVNDTWGHPVGDELLTVVATRLRTAAAPGGYVARLAGDEFVMLLPDRGADPAAAVTAILSVIAEPVHLDAATLRPHASAGVATTAHTGSSWPHLIAAADRALYQAKARGTHVAVHDHGSAAGDHEPSPRPRRRRRDRH